nr:bifunctional diaminohydroxyphosphoribosylaminopyrimidine deaminase/5-amino-6-(5-phosphoribosylamino)uracil reductase RibD [Allomuricauda sp.]
MNIHEKYMLRCMELGKKGLGTTAPNPMVGCVIVYQDNIIGEGFTSPYGGAHAEVNAINAVKDKGLLKQSTLYVTLEPCSHFGKTPPCSDLIIASKIPQVVIGLQDPHDKVAGKGIQKLQEAGCKVTVGVLEAKCRAHHKRFLTYQEQQRPYIILKWAESSDGYMAPDTTLRANNPEPYWITNPYSKQLVHQWRSEEQAILVGTRTVLDDNPRLSVRNWTGKNPIRIVVDRDLQIPQDYQVLDGSIPTLVLTAVKHTKLYKKGVDYILMDFSNPIAAQITKVLYQQHISSVFVEGGAKTLESFIQAGLWDEARIFRGAKAFGTGIKSPKIKGRINETKNILSDQLTIMTHD